MKTNAFVRKLASNDRKTRDRAFETLTRYLSSKSKANQLTLFELQKLWKGLYYTMWFSDRPLPQKRLALKMSSLFSQSISEDQFAVFVTAFWFIVAKEWPQVDKWRIDKYLLLMRYVIRECFVQLKNSEFDEKLVNGYISALEDGILSETSAPAFHIINIWLDELERELFGDEDEDDEDEDEDEDEEEDDKRDKENIEKKKEVISSIPVDKLLEPFVKLYENTDQKGLRKTIRENLFEDQRLNDWGVDTSKYLEKDKSPVSSESAKPDDDEEWNGFGSK
ncbi:DEKNAAC105652 [Brettanomyces naardenensis]|uniref:DEKNAAC105652 n=1 Tax=Brettanomyces naardenensis TaxID=13370 RepID=A0A448YTY0_BRENA|nr:DEKNAAC105652 [Brettanomyces naardenensis]